MRSDIRCTSRLALAALVALLCTTALLVGGVLPASATPTASTAASTAVSAAAGPAKPGKVRKVRLKKPTLVNGRAGFTIKWKRAARARNYKVKWWPVSRTSKHKDTTRGRSLVISHLAEGTEYCTKVKARNGKKKGPWSRTVCRTTAQLARPAAAWVDTQRLEGSPPISTALTLRWHRTPGARSYEIDYARGEGSVQRDPDKRTVTADSRAAVESKVISGLKPKKVYCFQVRTVNKFGKSARSTTHCNFTMPRSRAVPASSFGLDVGTYNVCSTVPDCIKRGGAWSTRQDAVAQRIAGLDVDAIALQEAGVATPYYEAGGLPGFTKACQVGDGYPPGTGEDQWNNQSLFVRDSSLSVVPGTANGRRFDRVTDDLPRTHGACWAEVVDIETGQHAVIASVHLFHVADKKYDITRYEQTNVLLSDIAAAYPSGAPPIVLAGDFNSHRARVFDGPRERLEQSGFHDGFDVAARYLSLPYQNSAHGWGTVPLTTPRWGNHLDHVFAPAGAHVASWQIHEPVVNGLYSALLSDHSPVRVSMLIPTS